MRLPLWDSPPYNQRMRTVSLLLVWAIVLHALPAAAEDPHSPAQRAESHYQLAVRLFGEGRYREALDEFDTAIALSPESIFFCNRAIVLLQLREAERALESLETCQRTHSGGREELADIDAQRAAVNVVVHHITSGARDTVSAMNAPVLVAPAPTGWGMTETGFLLAGIGAAALASAATLDFLSADLHADFVASSTADVTATQSIAQRREQYDALRQRYVTRQRVWLGLTAVGALTAATGLTLVVWSWSRNDRVALQWDVGAATGSVRFTW